MAIESLLVVTVGVLLGRLAWVALAPSDTAASAASFSEVSPSTAPSDMAASPAALLTQMNPFSGTPETEAAAAPGTETTLDLKLAGVRAVTGNTTASSAIIALSDGAQKRFVPGDEVMPGVVLVNVTGDAVHLSHNGTLETLSLYPQRRAPFVPAETPSADDSALVFAAVADAPAPEITPAALASDTVLTPEFRSGQVSGYRLEPRGAGAFEAAGLKSGDLILRVNGQAIEGLRPEQINQTVASGSDVALDVVRQGAIVRLRVSPNANFSQ